MINSIDEIDARILWELWKSRKKSTSTYQVAKVIFNISNVKENLYKMNSMAKFVEGRLKRMTKMKLVDVRKEKNGNKITNVYVPIKENCTFGSGKAIIDSKRFLIIPLKVGQEEVRLSKEKEAIELKGRYELIMF